MLKYFYLSFLFYVPVGFMPSETLLKVYRPAELEKEWLPFIRMRRLLL